MPVGKSSIVRAANSDAKENKALSPEKKENTPIKIYAEADTDCIVSEKDAKAGAAAVKTLSKFGVIEPLILRQTEIKTFKLLKGFETFNAAKQAGIKKIPSIIITCTDTEEKEIHKALNADSIKAEKEIKKETAKTAEYAGGAGISTVLPIYLL